METLEMACREYGVPLVPYDVAGAYAAEFGDCAA
jgi:hypothetical protein